MPQEERTPPRRDQGDSRASWSPRLNSASRPPDPWRAPHVMRRSPPGPSRSFPRRTCRGGRNPSPLDGCCVFLTARLPSPDSYSGVCRVRLGVVTVESLAVVFDTTGIGLGPACAAGTLVLMDGHPWLLSTWAETGRSACAPSRRRLLPLEFYGRDERPAVGCRRDTRFAPRRKRAPRQFNMSFAPPT